MKGLHFQFHGKRSIIDESAKWMIKAIISQGHFAVSSTGVYRVDIRQNVKLPGVFAVVKKRRVFIVVEPRNRLLSSVEKDTINVLLSAGVFVFVAHNLDSFRSWFLTLETALSMQNASLPSGCALND